MSQRIEDYALIGDCETAALVGRNGSIDWLCWPAFDSDACFAAILGTPRNGHWRIAPTDSVTTISRRYLGNTLILETRFETGSGTVALIDFMPPRGKASDIVRLVRGLTGTVKLRMELVIRFGFGVDIPWVRRIDHSLLAVAGQDMTVLRTHFVKPDTALAMTFSNDPQMGIVCEKFTGPATATLSTTAFALRTASLR